MGGKSVVQNVKMLFKKISLPFVYMKTQKLLAYAAGSLLAAASVGYVINREIEMHHYRNLVADYEIRKTILDGRTVTGEAHEKLYWSTIARMHESSYCNDQALFPTRLIPSWFPFTSNDSNGMVHVTLSDAKQFNGHGVRTQYHPLIGVPPCPNGHCTESPIILGTYGKRHLDQIPSSHVSKLDSN